MMSNLKPCPFCGGEAKTGACANGYHVYCGDCGADVMASTIETLTTCNLEKQVERAVEQWNNRQDAHPDKLPDHVKQAVQAKMPLTLDQLWAAILEELGDE